MRSQLMLLFSLMFFLPMVNSYAAQTCTPESIPASTPDTRLLDNGDNTITDLKTGLMWKKCLEGLSGNTCDIGFSYSLTWQQALEQARGVNDSGGFAGYSDWRLPNIRELISTVEGQCKAPPINLNRFPNTPSCCHVWSGTPYAGSAEKAWYVSFCSGSAEYQDRVSTNSAKVRLVRSGQ